MKKILSLTILCFFILAGLSLADMMNHYQYYPQGLAIATGTVEGTGRNSIDIYDEQEKRTERFIYTGDTQQFHKGDYIRVFYHPKTAIIEIIKRMKVFKYKGDGQNLGNIFYRN